jgi:hypothetical protein
MLGIIFRFYKAGTRRFVEKYLCGREWSFFALLQNMKNVRTFFDMVVFSNMHFWSTFKNTTHHRSVCNELEFLSYGTHYDGYFISESLYHLTSSWVYEGRYWPRWDAHVQKYMYTRLFQEFTHEHTQYACEHCRTHVYVVIDRSNLFNRPP